MSMAQLSPHEPIKNEKHLWTLVTWILQNLGFPEIKRILEGFPNLNYHFMQTWWWNLVKSREMWISLSIWWHLQCWKGASSRKMRLARQICQNILPGHTRALGVKGDRCHRTHAKRVCTAHTHTCLCIHKIVFARRYVSFGLRMFHKHPHQDDMVWHLLRRHFCRFLSTFVSTVAATNQKLLVMVFPTQIATTIIEVIPEEHGKTGNT